MYQTTTSFLYYLAIQEAAAKTMQHINNQLRSNIIEGLTLEQKFVLSQAPSVTIKGVPLYNKNEGYGTFLLPIVFIIVIFQTMLMATGVLYGDKTINAKKFLPLMIIGYTLLSIFLTGLLSILFNLPHIGNPWLVYTFLLLFIITTAAMASAASPLFVEAETVNLIVPFFSIGLIFLSGLSFPREQIPLFWRWVYYIFPSSPAVTGYIKLNSMGGDFASIIPEIKILFAQLIFYTLFYFTIVKKFINLPIKKI
jgi:ABC-2 type transporter.